MTKKSDDRISGNRSSQIFFTHTDPITGEQFASRTENHYEKNDGIPKAPPVNMPRMSLRERVERLQFGNQAHPYYPDQEASDDPTDWEDDQDPLTPAEQQYLEQTKTLERFEEQRAKNKQGAGGTPAETPSGGSKPPLETPSKDPSPTPAKPVEPPKAG